MKSESQFNKKEHLNHCVSQGQKWFFWMHGNSIHSSSINTTFHEGFTSVLLVLLIVMVYSSLIYTTFRDTNSSSINTTFLILPLNSASFNHTDDILFHSCVRSPWQPSVTVTRPQRRGQGVFWPGPSLLSVCHFLLFQPWVQLLFFLKNIYAVTNYSIPARLSILFLT